MENFDIDSGQLRQSEKLGLTKAFMDLYEPDEILLHV